MFHTKELQSKAATKVKCICDYRQMMEKEKKNNFCTYCDKEKNKLDQKMAEREKTWVKLKSQCAGSLWANRGLYLHFFVTFISTRERESEHRGNNISYTQYFPGK